MMQATVP